MNAFCVALSILIITLYIYFHIIYTYIYIYIQDLKQVIYKICVFLNKPLNLNNLLGN